jgi:hypothetical protein
VDRALFVAHQVMRDSIARSPQLVIDVEDCSTWITEDRIHAFMQESFDQDLRAAWFLNGVAGKRRLGCGC